MDGLQVVEILRTTELYSPQLMQEEKTRTDDPVATDLIGALLSVSPVRYYLILRYIMNKNNFNFEQYKLFN